MTWSNEEREEVYQIDRWGDGFFSVNQKGHVSVCPYGESEDSQKFAIDIKDVIDEMATRKIPFPAVIRFHDVLRAQVRLLNEAFNETIKEADYKGEYLGVYPIKVNQMREVVEEIIDAGSPYNYGLEAGSKAELMAVLSCNENMGALTVLNGYKDEEYIRMALLGIKLGHKVFVVIEKMTELETLIKVSGELNVKPLIGIRSKMSNIGQGKWAGSTGDRAKFGLSIPEVINAFNRINEAGLIDCFKLLHFHIGSQISDIRSIKEAITEGARIYANLVKMGAKLEYLDVGGGLGIDYDGSRSTRDSSRNYNLYEYVSNIVWGVKQICDIEEVPHPNLVSESGRAITAHHSCVVSKVIGKIDSAFVDYDTSEKSNEYIIVKNMREVLMDLNEENIQEMYNEALQLKDDSLNAFKLGILTLEEKAKLETLFWKINRKIYDLNQDLNFVPEEMLEFEQNLAPQYLCNFSVFQSAADYWAIDQLLPVVPITRLNEKPTLECTLADITCDSDGKIDQFIGNDDVRRTIPLHPLNANEDYYLGIFLTGAYQDVMGDMHNLFGRLNEVHVYGDKTDPSHFYIEEVIPGSSIKNVLSTMQYDTENMARIIKRKIDKIIQAGEISAREGVNWVDFYENALDGYTYLNK